MGKIKQKLRQFMVGRYGTDKLNMVILTAGVIISIVAMFMPFPLTKLLLLVVAIDDAVGLLLFSVSFGIAGTLATGGSNSANSTLG